jgi:hypothetical protein
MTTNKGTCIEATPDGQPFASKDGTKNIQGWKVSMSDGGHGYAYGPAGEPCPFEVGKEYSYYGLFTKKGQVRLTLATEGGVDRETQNIRMRALDMAHIILMNNPDFAGKPVNDYVVNLKLTAKSLEQHINRKD